MKLYNKAKKFAVVAIAAAPLMLSNTANAALAAADLTPVTTEISSDATLVFTSMIVIVGTVLAMTIGIKLLKRFGNKV